MSPFELIKVIHIVTAIVSIILFCHRAWLELHEKSCPSAYKVLPHINDSLLLILGIVMINMASLDVINTQWLLLKFILIVIYILFGLYSLKWATSMPQRKFGVMMSIGTFVAIILVAVNKQVAF